MVAGFGDAAATTGEGTAEAAALELWMRAAIVAHMVGFIAYAHSSVTKHRRTAEALRASEERLQAVLAREQEACQRAEEAHRRAEVATHSDLSCRLRSVTSR